ncbi:NAD(P)-binding protein [Dothidotthia symphoricarpi CBS 119687]|uniref:NAD(P)-binding protein n=1 Tax=Dothidotthia symphoricarpi CBS 119687 TaxID=1392245 RepID=A0A6A6A9U5_9PLEO|nr:NAD(P)-binding protein [Dothidotthia symphoricarpi CBS 119687]KAF2127854.1 NAD(P)-binding protein [Dothidotthia symphoricarpi CBS 119687]
MAAPSPTITLITGPNRGIGHGFLQAIVARPNNLVIAAVRDPLSKASRDLHSLLKGDGSRVKLVKLNSAIETDAAKAIESLKADGLEHIDRVIANAGIGDVYKPLLETDIKDIHRHMDVNFFGVLALVKAAVPLLQQAKDPKGPKMIFIGSGVASFAKSRDFVGPWFCYGVTKTAVHYTASQLHLENNWLTSVALSPGWVRTDGSAVLANTLGVQPPLSVEDSVDGCLKVIDEASRDKFSGELVEYSGQVISF